MPSVPCNAHASRRRTLRKRVAARRQPCAWCGKPIDYSLPAFHPKSFELDEIVSRWKGGDPLDPGNVQPMHRECNQAKYRAERAEGEARKAEAPKPPNASREW